MLKPFSIAAVTALSLLWGGTSPAISGGVEQLEDVIKVTFLQGWREQTGTHYAGIQIKLAKGWKTYWRAPGDGGIPTTIGWETSENLRDLRMFWPRPTVFRLFGLRSVGYTDRVVIPLLLTPKQDGEIGARLSLRMGVCKEICLPVDMAISAQLNATDTVGETEIRAALSDRPKLVDATLSCALTSLEDGYKLNFAATLPKLSGKKETAVVELSDPGIWVSEPAWVRQGEQVSGSVMLIADPRSKEIDLGSVRMTVLTTSTAIEINGCDRF